MIIHSDKLTRDDFYSAAKASGVEIVDVVSKGSRSRKGAFNFAISGSGRHGGQWGTQDYKAATWDEWGIFLAKLFAIDPESHTGKYGYLSAEHFDWMTGYRFQRLDIRDQHKRHKWAHHSVATSTYYVHSCDCGAITRTLARGITWDYIRKAA